MEKGIPSGLKRLKEVLKKASSAGEAVVSNAALCLIYFLVVAPLGLIFAAFKDPLGLREEAKSLWKRREARGDLSCYDRQY